LKHNHHERRDGDMLVSLFAKFYKKI